jgi:hypothetical protein
MKCLGSVVGPHIQLCRDILKDEGQLRQCRLSTLRDSLTCQLQLETQAILP